MIRLFLRRVANFCLLVCAAIALFNQCPASAQQTLGSLNGVVRDQSGATVAGATVTVTNTATELTRSTTAQRNGFYQIFNLPIGSYVVRVSHDGFDTTEVKGISIQEDRATTVDASLKVGKVSEAVEVTANPMLNAGSSANCRDATGDRQFYAACHFGPRRKFAIHCRRGNQPGFG
jgi:hypothetical protein